jgi:hypothetical protein
MTDDRQYCPLSPLQILQYFEEVKNRVESLESTLSNIVKLNNLTVTPPKPIRKSQMAKKAAHDDVDEDKKLINQAIAKHDRAEHPSATPTKIRKGGRVAAKTAKRSK